MTTGVHIRHVQSEQDDLDLPRIKYPSSRSSSELKTKYRKQNRHSHKLHLENQNGKSKDVKPVRNDYKNNVENKTDNCFPIDHKPLKPILSDDSLPDLDSPTNESCFPTALKPLKSISPDSSLPDLDSTANLPTCNKENTKAKVKKPKRNLHEEWKKYIPPLFSVSDDLHHSEAYYGEKQRCLYHKYNAALARTTKKHQVLHKTHELLRKSEKKIDKAIRNKCVLLPEYSSKAEHQSRQRIQFSRSLKSSKRYRLQNVKSNAKVKVFESRRNKKRKQLSERKSHISNRSSPVTNPCRSKKSRDRRFSWNSESSVSTLDSCASFHSCVSSASQNRSDVYFSSVSDSEIYDENNAYANLSDDEQDKINANLVKQREERKRHMSVDEMKTSDHLKPVQRAFSCEDKPDMRAIDKSIFDVIEELSDYSVNDEKKTSCNFSHEYSLDQDSPSTDKNKLKLQFNYFQNKLKMSIEKITSRSKVRLLTEIPEKQLLDGCHVLDQSSENDTNEISTDMSYVSDNPCTDDEKLKVQWKILQQNLRKTFHKISEQSKDKPVNMPKINRHFLDVLNRTENKKVTAVNDVNSLDNESPLPTIERRYNRYTCNGATGLNLIQNNMIKDSNHSNVDLTKTKVYKSNTPLHKLDITETSLYLSDLPVYKIDIKSTKVSLNGSDCVDENDLQTMPLILQDTQHQLKITDYFTPCSKDFGTSKGNCTDSSYTPVKRKESSFANTQFEQKVIEEELNLTKTGIDPAIYFDKAEDIPVIKQEQNVSVTDKNTKNTKICNSSSYDSLMPLLSNENCVLSVPIYDCAVHLERLATEKLKASDPVSSDEEIDRINANIRIKRSKSGTSQKRKVRCKTVPNQENSLHCSITSLKPISTNLQIFSNQTQAKQLECFLQEVRTDCDSVSDFILPQSHTDILQGCTEESCISLQHNLEFLRWFTVHYKPTPQILSQLIDIAFFNDVSRELVYRTYSLLQQICCQFPSCIEIDYDVILKCLDVVIAKQQNEENAPVSILQASLLLKVFVQALKVNLYSKNLSEIAEIRKSLAYSLFSYDVHSPYPRILMQYLVVIINNWESEEESLIFRPWILPTLQEFLALAVEVSSDYMISVSHLAEELKGNYIDLSSIKRKHLLLNSITSDLLRYKLTELLLESQYSGTLSLPTRFPDSAVQILGSFSKVCINELYCYPSDQL